MSKSRVWISRPSGNYFFDPNKGQYRGPTKRYVKSISNRKKNKSGRNFIPFPSIGCCGIWAWTIRDRGIPVFYYNSRLKPFSMLNSYINGRNQLLVNLDKTFTMTKKKKTTTSGCIGINPNDPRYRFSCR